jgi:hypothetical protein
MGAAQVRQMLQLGPLHANKSLWGVGGAAALRLACLTRCNRPACGLQRLEYSGTGTPGTLPQAHWYSHPYVDTFTAGRYSPEYYY